MSRVVDNRVVEMQFDNKQFEAGVQTSISTLEKLKQSLKLPNVSNSITSITNSIKNTVDNTSGLSNAANTVQAKFSAMQVVGVTALANIANAAVDAGTRMVAALTIDPIMTGFSEYETQIGAIQTILANTKSKGTTLGQVNAALDELNKYADKTIYNFTEMTRNIGTFTAAGVDLNTSVSAIKGIANLAAISGSTSQQASVAMYQLSQALAAGKVQLMDWNSVVNAGMGGQVFQDALKRTATQMGTNVDALIKKYGSFRESLTQGNWLTAEVLTETLKQLSGAYTEADLIAQGYTKKQAKEIVELANTAVSAATEVKTFTQLWDTLKEAAQSGWTSSWEILIGDFEEAKSLLTDISNTVGGMLNSTAEARNKILSEGLSSGWKQLISQGINDEEFFKDITTQVAKDHGIAIDDMIKSSKTFEKTLSKGWMTSDILAESIGKMTDKINNMSEEERKNAGYTQEQIDALNKLNDGIKDGSVNLDEYVQKMKMMSGRENIIAGLSTAFQSLLDILKPVKEAFGEIFPAITGDRVYAMTEQFKAFAEILKPTTDTLDRIKRVAKGVFSAVDLVAKGIKAVLNPIGTLLTSGGVGSVFDMLLEGAASIGDFFTALNSGAGTGDFFSGISDALTTLASKLSEFLKSAANGFRGLGDIFSSIGDVFADIAGKIGDALSSVFGWIQENISGGHIFAGLAGGGIFILLKKLGGLADKAKGVFDKGILGLIFGTGEKDITDTVKENPIKKITESVTGALDTLSDSLEAFTSSIKVGSLVAISVAIGILAMSLSKISELKVGDIAKSLFAMGIMFTMLTQSFKSITKTLDVFDHKGIIKAGFALIGMSIAMNIFASALKKVSEIPFGKVITGLMGLGLGLLELIGALKLIEKIDISVKDTIAIVILAEACKVLGDALSKFSGLSWDEIGRGLTSMGGALAELAIVLGILSKAGGGGSILGAAGILIAVQALDEISENLKKLGVLSWDEIGRGLGAMGGALGELTIALGILSKVGGFGTILGGAGILIAVQSLDEISENLKRLGSMSWDEIWRGLTGMGGALLEVAGMSGALGKIAGFSGLLGAGTINLAVQALKPISDALSEIGKLSWDEIWRGLTGMGGALAELAVISGATGSLTGLAGLVGAGTIDLAVQGLDKLANGFQKFAGLSWDEIGRGLTGMGGALAEITAGSMIAGISGIAGLVGAGTLTLATQGLGDLADALQKFGEMSWDEIGRGLTAMGAAMGETALGGILNTLSGFGAGAIAEIAEPLGTLADSLKKWSDVTVPAGLGLQLALLASGVTAFTLGGFGADAIATVAGPLGTMADSVKKWAGVTVPEGIGGQLSSLAAGVRSFTFAGFGADALSTAAGPLGTLATSVGKWANVTVPDGMQGKLEGLANGIKAFSFAFLGAWGISEAVGPIGDLAGAISKWNNITIPEGVQDKLKGLANGVKAFSFAFVGGWSIDAIKGPLGDLAGAVKKWNGVTIPTDMQDKLKGLADGVKAFNGVAVGNVNSVCTAVKNISKAVGSLADVDFSGIASKLSTFASSLGSISVSTDSFANLGKNIVDGLVNTINGGTSRVQAAANALARTAVTSFTRAVSGAASGSRSAGLAMVNGLISGIRSGIGRVRSVTTMIITAINMIIKNRSSIFLVSGRQISLNIARGISAGKSAVSAAVMSTVNGAASKLRGYYGSFFSAGMYVASGFAAGIRRGSFAASVAARAMANAASRAARSALDINSPSKVFRKIGSGVPEGFAQGIGMLGGRVKKATTTMTDGAVDGASFAMKRIGDLLDSDMDVQPTIRPVVDLSNVQSGAAAINSMLQTQPSVGVMANVNSIGSMMNQKYQNGANDDVVSAIDKLGKSLKNIGGPTYNVNGVTYDDGSNVSDAVGQLIRAVRVERRV